MTKTAELKYRHYVPYGWIALEYCELYFYGDSEASSKWHEIKFSEYNRVKPEIERLEKELAEAQSVKFKWYDWKNKYKQERIIEKIDTELEKVKKTRWKSTYTLEREARSLLSELNYEPVSSTSSGDECTDYKEIWKKS